MLNVTNFIKVFDIVTMLIFKSLVFKTKQFSKQKTLVN